MTDKKKKRYLEVLEEIKKERNLNVEEEKKKFDNYWKQYEASVQDSTLSRQSSMTGNKTDDFKETARAIIENSLKSGPSSPRYSQSYISGNSSEDFEEAADKIRKDISMEANYRQRARLTASEMKKSQKKQKELEQERSNYIINYDATIQAEGEEILSKLNEEEMKSLDLYVKSEGAPLLKDDYIKGLREKGYTEKEIEKAADVRKRQLDAIKTAEEMEKSAKFAEEHEVLASILSVPQKFIGGIASAGSSIMQYFDDPYRSINTNTGAFLLTNKANAARQEVASDMGSVGAFLYNTGMSIGDMSLAMLAGNKAAALSGAAKVGSATTLGSMGVQAFSDTVIDLTARGANAEQAMQGGLAAGTFEILFEKVSLGNFNKLKQVPATELKGFVKNVAKSIGVNASEEMFTEAANIIYDTLANGDISNLELQVKALMEAGYSESEAKEEVKKGFRLQVLEAGLAGGLTGGTLGVAGQAKGTYRASQNSKAIIESEVEKRAGEERKKTAIDNEVEKIIAERSETFGELSEKEKNVIREDVINKVENGEIDYSETEIKDDIIKGIQKQVNEELDRGELSIDAVETALAKEEKETINRLSEELENAKTDEERSRVEAEINKTRLSLAEKMQKSLRSDIRLQEIYKQEMLKSEDIDVVEQKTDSDITKELIKSAKAVNMNNTRKSHELFDFVNKVANDIKTNYRIVNDAQLRQLGYEVDGQAVNGLVRKNSDGTYNVLLNVEAGKESQALAVIIGHETTHLLETTEEYSRLKTLLKEYAKSKGEYDSKLESIKKLYKDVDADIEGEVTADLIGEYLLADEKFVKELSAKEPNIFQKLYNHIKRIVKMATAGSEQQKQLLKLQESFKKAYKELGSTQKTSEAKSIDGEISTELGRTTSEEVKYSLKQFEDGRRFVEVDQMQERFEGHNISEFPRIAKDIINEKFVGKVVGIDNKMFVNGKGRDEYSNPSKYISGDIYEAKLRTSGEIDNLLDAGVNFRNEADGKDGHIHKNITGGFDYFDTLFKIGDRYYEAVINIMNIKRGKLFKDVTKIKDVTQDIMSSYGKNPKSQFLRTSSTNSISNTEQKSNIKYSIAGEKALNKNNEYLKQAKVMELAGKTSEEIRKDTGWFRGLDNKWRFEINSSEMKVDTKGKFHRNPDISRYQTLLEKAYFTGTATEAEIKELQQLDKTLKGALTEPKKLGDLIDYPQLLEAYPDLADVNIVFSEDLGEIKGTYSSKRNEIVINKSLKSNMKELKQTLLHEMQHAIQDIEGFAKGSNTIGLDYWNSAGEIEARDVANRLGLNEQQRKDVRPDIDNDSAIVKFSLKSPTKDTKGRSLATEQQSFYKNVSPLLKDESGNLKVYYHGTGRADRVGTFFDPERATSGPMAFFTDDAQIAVRYSKDKQDTSLAYDSEYDSYETQFRVDIDGESRPIQDLWYKMSQSQRQELIEKAKHIVANEDDGMPEIDISQNRGLGNYDDFLLGENQGNGISALIDSWLNDGNLFGEEERFVDVLRLAGIDNVQYLDPKYREEKVYETYLNITNPLDTSQIDEDFIDALVDYVKNTDVNIHNKEKASAYMWDKNGINIYDWIDILKDDVERGTTHAWTIIPDVVTDFLKDELNIDGIVDRGGKNGGDTHQVVIPFYSNQIKDVSNKKPTADPDIRFSLRNKNITEETEIPYVVNNQYITVQKNNNIALAELQDRVKNLPRGTYENKATGYKADINRRTIGKILNPTKRFNPWSKSHNYIENLNAAAYLPELFENAVYLDTHENQKKNNGEEFHYFVAPIYMNNKAQRALITARSGEKYDVLYVVRVEVIENKEDAQAAEQMLSASIGSPSTITIPDLIKDVKIYNYDTQENQEYTPEDIKYHLSKRGEDIAPVKGWAIYGKDVLVKNRKTGDDIAPIREDILSEVESKTENAATVMEDIAPVRKDIKPKTTEMSGDIAPVKATEKITEYVNTQPRGEEKQRPLLRSAIGSTSREIKRLYGSKYDPTKDIARLYKGIHEGKYNEEEIARISTDIGQRIVENVKSKKVRTDEANEVLGLLRQTKVKLDSEQKTEVEAKYGSYNEYRKNMMGKIILSKDGTSLEAVWEDWSELYPDIFDIDMDPKAMPEELENIMSSLQRSYQIEDTPDAEEVGAEIYDRFFSIPQRKKTRAEVQDELFEGIRKEFENNGYDVDEVFSNAKSKTTFSSVDNTPQRFIEKTFGYKAGQIINDLTINKEAENESKCVRWLNTITGKKTGLLPRLSEKYNIKPGSKEDAAVQMYAEGFYVNKKQEYVRYGDEELAKDFPDEQTQENIKKLARDPEVRAFYDNTLRMINETRKRNAYPEIPKRENYFLHFHAMEDTFSKIGIPFNINDIKLKDLPSDLNGITAGLRPGQPYFASANRRTGIRTTYGALRGMERYAFAAGRQIYHIDDIQTLRAIWKHIADTYGQAKGLENLDELDRKQQEEQIKRVYDGHLSTFARFINEQANILAGKTAALDRGFESIFGRKGLAVLNFFDKQAGRNAVGYNISSALTNLVAGVQGISKMPKADAIKAFAQTASNKLNNLRGEDDGFAEQNDFIVRRKGSSSFYRTPWQKATDRGYVMMQAVDDITTEFVVRGKYNEYIRRGMSEADAHEQAGKWAAKLLGDRSLGQMPQLYNSKVMNIFAKFQLEVRNQLDSMLYDTVKEAEIDTESISSAKKRNSIKAAKITSTLAQLAVFQHLFGKAFEAVTGYNPAFDIISVLMTMLGIGDDEDSEDTFKDNLEQAFFELLEDLPYTSTLTGGRIPISSMLPVEELVTGKDSYGNEKSRLKTLLEASPYLLPAGYGQIKKTYQGLKMFDEDLPVKGSYTNSGNLRYPVEDTVMNRIQAGLFGQYANKNAREYFDEERIPLKTKDIEEYKELNIPIGDYWKYKDEIKKRDTKPEKVDYISSLDLPVSKKNLLANNVLDRKEKVDLDGYEDYGSFEEFDFATKNPGEYSISKTVGGYSSYKKYREEISSFKADRDSNGKSISGTKKAKIVNYINSLNTSYGSKLILYKMQYPSDDTYNYEIVEYLNSQQYLSYNDIKEALEAMEFTVDSEGNVRW